MTQSRRPLLVAMQMVGELGFLIALPLVILAIGGRWIDHRFGTSPWALLSGVVVSIISTSLLLVRKFSAMVKDIEASEQLPPKT